MELLSELIASFNPSNPNYRPTEIYNENWLIKLVFHQASSINDKDYFLGFLSDSIWYSEGLLPTAFKARAQGDPLSESRTNTDGVIGHIRIGHKSKTDLELVDGAKQFTVVEAKIGSHLSSGVIHAKYFDQAARNVACMAEVMARAGVNPTSLKRLEFVVLAPQYSIDKGTFAKEINPESIQSKVRKRVAAYEGELDDWYKDHFEPTLNCINIQSLSWESALGWISDHKSDLTEELKAYYDLCLKYK